MPAVGVGVFVFCVTWYIDSLGRELAIVPVVALVASAQWLLGPYLAYNFDLTTEKYRMYVDQDDYFIFVLPSIIAFIGVLHFLAPKITLEHIGQRITDNVRISNRVVYAILVLGFVSDAASAYAPASIGFLFFLTSQFKFIAVAYMLILKMKGRWWLTGFAFAALVGSSLETGLFHDIALWSALILSFVAYEFRLSTATKAAIVLVMAVFAMQLQTIKSQYREILQTGLGSGGIEAFFELFLDNHLSDTQTVDGDDLSMLNARLNQGWIISAIMNYVPAFQQYENGRTVIAAARDSVLPRLLSGKRAVNMSESFIRYTGLSVGSNTSFGISVVGEAWVNFGEWGIAFMLLFGAFYGGVLKWIYWISKKYPTVILWAPLVFLQAIKAETELVVVMNHMVKSGMFLILIYYLAYRVLKVRI